MDRRIDCLFESENEMNERLVSVGKGVEYCYA